MPNLVVGGFEMTLNPSGSFISVVSMAAMIFRRDEVKVG